SLRKLARPGRTIVVIEPVPIAPARANPRFCLPDAHRPSDCEYDANAHPTPIERTYRSLARNDRGLVSLDIDRLVCPRLPVCDPIVRGVIVKLDFDHLSEEYSASLAGPLRAALARAGVPLDGS